MADVPVNPGSPDPREAAEAQDSSPLAPAAEPEGVLEPELVTAAVEPSEAPEPSPPAEEPATAAWSAPVAQEPAPEAAEPSPAPVVEVSVPEAAISEVTATPPPPEPAPSAPPAPTPSIAATLEAPPQAAGSAGAAGEEGGEWDLLMGKLQAFLDGGALQAWWDRLGGPLRAAGLLIGLVLVLRLYGALLDTLDDLPLVPRLLQLAGLIALVRFALTRLVRTEERQAVLNDWKERWQRFRGSP